MQEQLIEYKYYLTSEKMVSKNTVESYTKDIENYLNRFPTMSIKK